jgi:hypothetical protein
VDHVARQIKKACQGRECWGLLDAAFDSPAFMLP